MARKPGFRHSGVQVLDHLLASFDEGGRAEVEELLFDAVTHLPTLHVLLKRLQATLRESRQVGVLTLQFSPLVRLEELFGWETYDELLRATADLLGEIKQECMREGDLLAELSVSGNTFVFVLAPPRYNPSVTYQDLDRLRRRLGDRLVEELSQRFAREVVEQFPCSIGCVVIDHDPRVDIRRLILRGLDQAYSDGFEERERTLLQRAARLREVIDQGLIRVVYQPIVSVEDGRLLGYEAFSRAPTGEFENTEYMFQIASETNLLWKLERACHREAVRHADRMPEGALLFLNIDPDAVFDPHVQEIARLEGLVGRIVFEITERAGITDYARLRRVLDQIREVGCRVAIDDMGSAYSGLRLIAETRPDFLKLDLAITRNVTTDAVARELVRTIQVFADNVDIPLIVEGVETTDQLIVLRDLGVRYAQGYLVGRPAPDFEPAETGRTRAGPGGGAPAAKSRARR